MLSASVLIISCGGGGSYPVENSESSQTSPTPDPVPTPDPAPEQDPTPTPDPGPAGTASIVINWNKPNSYSDGSPLTSVNGYRIHYGTNSGQYTQVIDTGSTANPSATNLQVDNLSVGQTYYFSISAYDSSGNESDKSTEANITIN